MKIVDYPELHISNKLSNEEREHIWKELKEVARKYKLKISINGKIYEGSKVIVSPGDIVFLESTFDYHPCVVMKVHDNGSLDLYEESVNKIYKNNKEWCIKNEMKPKFP